MVDVETTGLSPRYDRVVELAIVVVRPGEEPAVVFDSLIRPGCAWAGTEVHGIAEQDVADAPCFGDLAPAIAAALANRVLCSHNAQFDVEFLRCELERTGYGLDAPHLCTMLLPRAIDPAVPTLSLARACERFRVARGTAHAARHDALAAAQLLRECFRMLRARGVQTFRELRTAARGEYRFLASFERALLGAPPVVRSGKGKPRGARPAHGRRAAVAEYLETLLDAVADLHLTPDEIGELQRLPARLELTDAEVRAVHAKVFWAMLGRYVEDARIDAAEASHLSAMRALLSTLGWTPGDHVVASIDDAIAGAS